ncbi:hypothetical protein E5K00_09960 [Hymenobacter aquaticus]|uniref:Uncharacterized protein n=1 Tax=Hymenobacter aquaticus TaxID=1867101 RepID=A0A4Z0Q9T1_9BACT|nr:hypothetical protein [Hymenobacter aquaticus]TGE25492.1 hypothetical protein E5K00_09960 [Hymenobacter aquaticus]
MVPYSAFQNLSAAEQQALVTQGGTFLLTRPAGVFLVDLYYLPGYYCEVWRQLPTAAVAYLHAFTEQAGLYPYLAHIRLPPNILV